jgi:hypothetical protein
MHRHPRRRIVAAWLGVLAGLALLPAPASGQPKPYSGLDAGAGPGDAHPNYTTALKAFEGATGAFSVITFDGAPAGPFSNPNAPEAPATSPPISLGQGVTMVLQSVDPRPPAANPEPWVFGITSDHQAANDPQTPFIGYNTSDTGNQFLRFVPYLQPSPADVTFTFSKPVSAFGMAITGYGGQIGGNLHLLFNAGGVAEDLPLSGSTKGGLLFYGVGNLPGPVTQFTLEMRGVTSTQRDVIGIDDLRFAAVPEPGTFALFALGTAALLGAWARRRHRRGGLRAGSGSVPP